jgi:importin-7
MEFLANEGARLRAAQEKRLAAGIASGASEEASVEDGDPTDEDELGEDLGFISPLENVDPFETFKSALTSECQLCFPFSQ